MFRPPPSPSPRPQPVSCFLSCPRDPPPHAGHLSTDDRLPPRVAKLLLLATSHRRRNQNPQRGACLQPTCPPEIDPEQKSRSSVIAFPWPPGMAANCLPDAGDGEPSLLPLSSPLAPWAAPVGPSPSPIASFTLKRNRKADTPKSGGRKGSTVEGSKRGRSEGGGGGPNPQGLGRQEDTEKGGRGPEAGLSCLLSPADVAGGASVTAVPSPPPETLHEAAGGEIFSAHQCDQGPAPPSHVHTQTLFKYFHHLG